MSACATAPTPAPQSASLRALPSELTQQTLADVRVRCPLRVENPTREPAELGTVRWEARVNEGAPKFGKAQLDVRVPAGQAQQAAFSVALPSVALVSQPETASYSLDADIEMNTSGGVKTVNASWDGRFVAPQKPGVEVNAQAARSDELIETHFTLAIHNANGFAIPLDGFLYRLHVGETEVAQAEVAVTRELDPGTMLEFDLHEVISAEEHADVLDQLNAEPELAYTLETTVRIGEQQFEIPVSGTVSFPEE